MKTFLAGIVAGALLIASAAVAQDIVIDGGCKGGCPAPDSGGSGDTGPGQSSDSGFGTANAIACGLGEIVLSQAPKKRRLQLQILMAAGCITPAGFVGGVAAITTFSDRGWLVRLIRSGLKCTEDDVDLVAGCREALAAKGIKLPPVDVNAVIALNQWANR